jgi:hypothetical protein
VKIKFRWIYSTSITYYVQNNSGTVGQDGFGKNFESMNLGYYM